MIVNMYMSMCHKCPDHNDFPLIANLYNSIIITLLNYLNVCFWGLMKSQHLFQMNSLYIATIDIFSGLEYNVFGHSQLCENFRVNHIETNNNSMY